MPRTGGAPARADRKFRRLEAGLSSTGLSPFLYRALEEIDSASRVLLELATKFRLARFVVTDVRSLRPFHRDAIPEGFKTPYERLRDRQTRVERAAHHQERNFLCACRRSCVGYRRHLWVKQVLSRAGIVDALAGFERNFRASGISPSSSTSNLPSGVHVPDANGATASTCCGSASANRCANCAPRE